MDLCNDTLHDMRKYRKENKYFDLKIILIKDDIERDLYAHKIIVCERSDFISMLIRRQQEQSKSNWPPVHTIRLILPSQIEIDDMSDCIDILYNEKCDISIDRALGVIYGLDYLSAQPNIILNKIIELLPSNRILNEQEINLLIQVLTNYSHDKMFHNMVNFYFYDLRSSKFLGDIMKYLVTDENPKYDRWNKLMFGYEMEASDLIKIKCHNKSDETGWDKYVERCSFNFPSLDDTNGLILPSPWSVARYRKKDKTIDISEMCRLKFKVFGVNFILKRLDRNMDDYCDYLQLEIDHDVEKLNTNTIKLRVTCFFYYPSEEPSYSVKNIKSIKINEFNEVFYGKKYYLNCFDPPIFRISSHYYGPHDKVRATLIFENFNSLE